MTSMHDVISAEIDAHDSGRCLPDCHVCRKHSEDMPIVVPWKRVDVSLPPLTQPCLLYCAERGHGFTGSREYCADAGGWVWCRAYMAVECIDGERWELPDAEHDDDYKVTHWMAFPAPPKAMNKPNDAFATSVHAVVGRLNVTDNL